ncbi:ABC transporter permease subunit [Rhizobium sp. Leaf306]|uniref:ABC transporter permease subunit n=1 Tax=Rhizobium sp. Leaf306 TaxID=1736330 RepID=UPI000B2B5BDD|nr:ABC transporter permease subunit [Rhizobium sp. Leaf306]
MISAVLDNRRFRSWGGQILLLGGFAALLLWLVNNTVTNLDARGIKVGFDFLWRRANFPISESVLPYDPSDSFLWAYVTGVGNTLVISALAIFLSTALGLLVGLARRSKHPLTSGVAGVFVTTMRNMPLIVHLLFWYALATTTLPAPREAYNPLPGVFLSLRGFYIPALDLDASAWAVVGLVIAVTFGTWRLRRHMTGIGQWHDRHPVLALLGLTAAVALGAALLLQPGAVVSFPEMRGFNFTGGLRLSPEFAALMLGLVIYTSAFIG